MRKLHGITRREALDWWKRCKIGYLCSTGPRLAAVMRQATVTVKAQSGGEDIIPFTGHHPNQTHCPRCGEPLD